MIPSCPSGGGGGSSGHIVACILCFNTLLLNVLPLFGLVTWVVSYSFDFILILSILLGLVAFILKIQIPHLYFVQLRWKEASKCFKTSSKQTSQAGEQWNLTNVLTLEGITSRQANGG